MKTKISEILEGARTGNWPGDEFEEIVQELDECFKEQTKSLEDDLISLGLRLYGEDKYSFGPESAKVMDRLRPLMKKMMEYFILAY